MMNETHDPSLRSWVRTANIAGADFPIQNLPFGVFRRLGTAEAPRIGIAIGDQILDLCRCLDSGLFDPLAPELLGALRADSLNSLMALGADPLSQLRSRVSELLRADSPLADESLLLPVSQAELFVPAKIGDYTDFYASVFHARNVGRLFRPDTPLLPNYKYVPIAYGGRSSSIVVSGACVHRPYGQTRGPEDRLPAYGPSARLDYEVEIGALIGQSSELGQPVRIEEAESHMFGLCLLNDWSARDVQAWEAQPLGPFLAKNFATTVSPWVVTLEALAPFRVPASGREAGDPEPLPYLYSEENQERGGFDVTVEVFLQTSGMRAKGLPPQRLSRGSLRNMYWTFAQMVTHQSCNGCNLRPGDLQGSGTVSGPTPDSLGCLLELTEGGKQSISLPDGESRTFLADGDEVIFRAHCERPGYARIGFGECRGTIVAGCKQSG